MFIWWGKDLINIYNDAYMAIVGGKHPQALGQPAYEVWKEIWDQVEPRVDQAINKNEGTYDEALLLIMERNGYQEETYYTFSYSPVPGDNGRPEGIICANTDDTERIIGERQLRTLKDLGKAYINSKSDQGIYQSTLQTLRENPADFPFAMIYQAEENKNALMLAGATEDVGNHIAPRCVDTGKDATPWFIAKHISTDHFEVIYDMPCELPKGMWPVPPFQSIVLPITKTGQANIYGLLVVGINPYRLLDEKYISFFQLVTDQIASAISNMRAYKEEQKRVSALTEINKAKTVFFNNVSHEFRTPLTLMLGPLEELIWYDAGLLPGTMRDNIASTYRNAQRLLKLVNSLLEFSRIEAGRLQATYKPVNLALLTADIASGFRSTIEKAGLKYQVDCSGLRSIVYVDKEMWEKIVLNLLSNAFKYTLHGRITVTLGQHGNHAVLKVHDTGAGIPVDELPRMFERFHRIPNTIGRTHEGTGIGLSLIYELVKLHHGEISVESTAGRGSTFIVMIPLGKLHLREELIVERHEQEKVSKLTQAFVNEASALISNEIESGNQLALDLPPKDAEMTRDKTVRILVVDDNPDMRAYLRRIIEPYFMVSTAPNGRKALQQISHSPPNMVVSDMMMPLMNGKELVRAIRSNPSISRMPFIMLSAQAGEESRIDGLEAGADDCLTKPFSGKELITKIRSQISIAKARNHAEELLKQLFINAPMAISILRGPQLLIELANDNMLEIWGKTDTEVANKPIMEALPELRGQGLYQLMTNVLATGRRYVSNEHPTRLMRKGHLEKVYVKFIYEPICEADGRVSGVIVLAHEITDLVNARKLAQKSADELAKQVKRKDEFMSIASHELKTPVTTMKASLQILEKMQVADAQAVNFIGKANRQMDRLSVLVSDLLDVTSLQSGKMKFYLEKFSFDELVAEVIEQYQQSHMNYHIHLEGDTGITISADRNRLEQVINNLLSNAIKYSPESDRIIVNVEQKKGAVKLSVRDFGIGIPRDKIAYVFERFYRADESAQSFSGLGLGLYISSGIIERHNGKIGAMRNKDQGSTFWFILPTEKC